MREGGTIVIHSMDRLAQNLDDLRRIMQNLTKAGIGVEFVKEVLIFTSDDLSTATLLLSVVGNFAEFGRSLLREQQHEGITLTKQRGTYCGRKKALALAQAGEEKAHLAREFGISRETV